MIELVKSMNAYIISLGPMIIPYYSIKTHDELTDEFKNNIGEGKPFIIDIDKNGPKAIINPAPGMVVIIMTKDQFERNRGMQQIIGKS